MGAITRAVLNFYPIKLIRVAWRRFVEDNSFALAGYLAYTGLLSFFPFMIFLIVSASFIVGPESSRAVVDEMFALAPAEVTQTLKPVLETIIASKTGLLALVAALVGLWAGSNAFEAARIGFNLAYDVREDRHFVRRRLESLAFAGSAAVVFVSLAFLIVLWPTIARLIAPEGGASIGFQAFYVLRYAIGVPLLGALLVVLHLNLPKGTREGLSLRVLTEHGESWRISVIPGVIASGAIWFLGATALSLYLRYSPGFAGNYGAMAGVVITLLFFYMSSIAVFFGAQINIAAEELRRRKKLTRGELSFSFKSDPGAPALSPVQQAAAIEKAGGDAKLAALRHALLLQG